MARDAYIEEKLKQITGTAFDAGERVALRFIFTALGKPTPGPKPDDLITDDGFEEEA